MTAPTLIAPAGDVRTQARAIELVLAHMHLRLASLALARVELETLAGLGGLDTQGLVDLAEVRWRTGDLVGAGEAAAAALPSSPGGGSAAAASSRIRWLKRGPSRYSIRMYRVPSSSWPISNTLTTLGCCTTLAARASLT